MSLQEGRKLWNKLRDRKITTAKSFEQIQRDFAAVEREIEVAGGLDGFFETVGQGLVRAQESLDRKSSEYVAQQPSFPTMFRIPKVSAEIKFAASQRSGGGFLAKIFTGSEEQSQETGNSVSFDVVAAPPPPEMVQQLLPRFLESFVVSDLVTRTRLSVALNSHIEDLKKNEPGEKPKLKRLKPFGSKKEFDRLIIFRHPQGWALVRVFMMGDKPSADVAYLMGDLESGSRLELGGRTVKEPLADRAAALRKLLEWMSDFADSQEARIKQIRE